jgi:predicted DCC family thiol-disulfide oxidoreductase YuxK
MNGLFLAAWGLVLLIGPTWLLEAAAQSMPLSPRPVVALAGLVALAGGLGLRLAPTGAAGCRVLGAVAGIQALAVVLLTAWLLAGGGGLTPRQAAVVGATTAFLVVFAAVLVGLLRERVQAPAGPTPAPTPDRLGRLPARASTRSSLAATRARLRADAATAERVVTRGIPDLSADALGLFRIAWGAALLWALLSFDQSVAGATRDYPWWGSWGWIDSIAASPGAVSALETVTAVALCLFIVGLLTRLAYAVAVSGLTLWVLTLLEESSRHDWSLPVTVTLLLVFVPWGAGLSVDEAVRRIRGRATPTIHRGRRYGIAPWLVGFCLGLGWLAAAFAKYDASGLEWALGGAGQYHWVIDADAAPVSWGTWIASHQWMAVVASVVGMATEALFITHVLVRRTLVRGLFGVAGALILVVFFLFQGVFWVAWWALLLAFVPWQWLYESIVRALPANVVLVDGECPVCRQTARVLHGLDLFDRMVFVDANDEEALHRYAPGLDGKVALRAMAVVGVPSGKVALGYRGYLQLASSVPVLWPFALLGGLPSVRVVGERVYEQVAARRHRGGGCSDTTCAVADAPLASRLPAWRPQATAYHALPVAWLLLIGVIVVTQVAVSREEVEQEPFFSNFPMYATTFPSREVFDARAERALSDYNLLAAERGAAVTERIEALDAPGPSPLLDAAERALERAEVGSGPRQPVPEEQEEDLRALRAEYRERYGEPLGPVRVVAVSQPFDWSRGTFSKEPRRLAIATVQEDAVLLHVAPAS